jgi:uncharacterized small protein (DUF1192 family)
MEDEEAPRRRRLVERPVLDSFGVEELNGYITELRMEIARAEAMIARKSSHRGAAEAFFAKK